MSKGDKDKSVGQRDNMHDQCKNAGNASCNCELSNLFHFSRHFHTIDPLNTTVVLQANKLMTKLINCGGGWQISNRNFTGGPQSVTSFWQIKRINDMPWRRKTTANDSERYCRFLTCYLEFNLNLNFPKRLLWTQKDLNPRWAKRAVRNATTRSHRETHCARNILNPQCKICCQYHLVSNKHNRSMLLACSAFNFS